jgi:ribosomal-protein-alanine N-acetyltransferase
VGPGDPAPTPVVALTGSSPVVTVAPVSDDAIRLETDRLLLRPWRTSEAATYRELWAERDPRVPPHRRLNVNGRPTVADLEDWIRASSPSDVGLLALERKDTHDLVGYCGLVDSGRGAPGEPELAFELLRRFQRHGYAAEASTAVLAWAQASGYQRLWATVWDWNTASLRVLAKVGFTRTDQTEEDPERGTTLFLTRRL